MSEAEQAARRGIVQRPAFTEEERQVIYVRSRHGMHGGGVPLTEEEAIRRFWARVDKRGDCWLWTGSRDSKSGYGIWRHMGKRSSAHRIAYVLTHGPLSRHLQVCHNCPGGDNPQCVRPDHMYEAPARENAQDRVRKGTQRRGETNGGAKLTERDVREMRRRRKDEGLSYRVLGELYGVSYYAARAAITGQTWTHVT